MEREFLKTLPSKVTFEDLRPKFDGWAKNKAFPLAQSGRDLATRNGVAYFAAFREAEGIRGGARARAAKAMTYEQFLVGMRATLLTSLAGGMRRANHAEDAAQAALYLDEASDMALSGASGSLIRNVLDGDRETVLDSIRTDKVAKGYARVTDSNPCDFCEMLAGRGAVFGEESADFEAHDKCACSAEPSFD